MAELEKSWKSMHGKEKNNLGLAEIQYPRTSIPMCVTRNIIKF